MEDRVGIGLVRARADRRLDPVGFYGSTPAYKPVLELHGWGELGDELKAMTKRGEWDKLGEMIDDEVLHRFAVVGAPEEAIAEVKRR